MLQFIALILYMTSLGLVLLMLYQFFRGTADLLSARNIFLVGFIVFQTNNAAKALWRNEFGEYPVMEIPSTPAVFTFLAVLFLIIMLVVYQRGFFVKSIAAHFAKAYSPPSSTSMLMLAVIFVATGAFCRLVLAELQIQLFPQTFAPLGSGLLFVAAAMAGWVWAPRLLNPVVGGICAGIIAVALIPTLMGFSRREVVGVAIGLIWGAYHGHWKSLGYGQILLRLGVVGLAGFVVLAAHTMIRGVFLTKNAVSLTETLQLLRGADVGAGASDLASGQSAGAISMWIIETRPQTFPYDTLHSARLFLLHPVPRLIYPSKPMGLGQIVPGQSSTNYKYQRTKAYNVGPGLVGHIVNDNPWLALPIYAVFFGLYLRFLDETVRYNGLNPFVLLPIGVGLGQIVGIPRGEAGHFLFLSCLNMAGAYVGMWLFVRVLTMMGFVMKYDQSIDPAAEAYAEDQYSNYGQEWNDAGLPHPEDGVAPEYANYGETTDTASYS